MARARECWELERGESGELIPTRRSLLSRLKNWSDEEAWLRFFNTYWKLIYNAAIWAGLNDAEEQDVVQETLIAVWKNIPEFDYDPAKGSFKTWLLQQTTWRIKGQFRKRMPVGQLTKDVPVDIEATDLERVPDPALSSLEDSWNTEWEKATLQAASNLVKAKVSARQYQIFDLLIRTNSSPFEVARTLRISIAKVYLAKHRVGNLLKKELWRLKNRPE